jgi:hypothetical protein
MKKTLYILLIPSLLMTGCTSNANRPGTPQALQPTAISTALFQIIKADGTRFDVTIEVLRALRLAQVQADDIGIDS